MEEFFLKQLLDIVIVFTIAHFIYPRAHDVNHDNDGSPPPKPKTIIGPCVHGPRPILPHGRAHCAHPSLGR